jgi:hypothetical protein
LQPGLSIGGRGSERLAGEAGLGLLGADEERPEGGLVAP